MKAVSQQGRVVVVTGGASGIGKSCAEILAERGALVVVLDRDADAAAEVAKSIQGRAYELDISDAQAVERVAGLIEREIGAVHGLVANAGIIQSRAQPPEQLPMEDWDRIFSINVRGTFQCCVSFGGRMAKRGAGSIVTIASIAGMRSTPHHAYNVSKAAVLHMTTNLSVEWGRSGVRVNAVSPGYTLTPALEDAISRKLRDTTSLVAPTALGRMVRPSEVAHAVAFLLSDEAAAITGVNLPVDAGWLAGNSWGTYDGVPPSRSSS
jgi:NAD(P)-dependent dehydrogenase (short-subunit alcohol dehydrogenase family)